eukprot:CAMPEP_0194037858 /NCGR_PEP_ID=MMETSP0009_2-20130614/10187_1 /TAXON_ID=210454 /ORGANISM="Grammatophora oceanica, Strain CCMP 410" /LENGTH=254 /DNA_ID=CAMNT_0038680191 /DNA_START=112 /DNA_END=876 /DNA_ORIENTATION=-
MLALKAAQQKRRTVSTPMSRRKGGGDGSSSVKLICCSIVLVIFAVGSYLYYQTEAAFQQLSKTVIDGSAPSGGSSLRQGVGGGNHGTMVLIIPEHGEIKIGLKPELSQESVQYIEDLVSSGCADCKFYRAEAEGILQGILKSTYAKTSVKKGDCPVEFQGKQQNCPAHDPNCGCHGPTMVKGMVGWAGGGTGPDFFISNYNRPATWWGQQHTVFGHIVDPDSLNVLDKVVHLPATKRGGMTFLDDKIHFQVEIR